MIIELVQFVYMEHLKKTKTKNVNKKKETPLY